MNKKLIILAIVLTIIEIYLLTVYDQQPQGAIMHKGLILRPQASGEDDSLKQTEQLIQNTQNSQKLNELSTKALILIKFFDEEGIILNSPAILIREDKISNGFGKTADIEILVDNKYISKITEAEEVCEIFQTIYDSGDFVVSKKPSIINSWKLVGIERQKCIDI